MGFLVTRQQARNRVIRDAHRQGDTGTVSFVAINEHWQDEYNTWSWEIANNDRSSLGRSHRALVATVAQSIADLPVEFGGLTGWRTLNAAGKDNSLPPVLIRQEEALALGWLDPTYQNNLWLPDGRRRYYLEGPGQEYNEGTGQLEPFGLRLRLFPRLEVGESLIFTYKTQPLYLGDPAEIDMGADLVPIELIAPPNYDALVARVRVKCASRGDADEENRSVLAVREAALQTVTALTREDRYGTVSADNYIDHSRGTTGYQ